MAGRYACPRCSATYCSLVCFRDHGDRCSEGFFKESVKAALAEEPQKKARWVGDLLKGAPSPEIDEARLLQLLDGSVQPTKAEEQLVLRAIANGELESEPWAPWWRDLGRLDDDLADCAAKYDALSAEALRDADAARRLYEAERRAEQTEAELPGGEVTRARVLARSSKAPPLWLLVWAPSDAEHAESVARVCRDNLNATAAPAPSIASALYAYCAAARALRRLSPRRGRRGGRVARGVSRGVPRRAARDRGGGTRQCGAAGDRRRPGVEGRPRGARS